MPCLSVSAAEKTTTAHAKTLSIGTQVWMAENLAVSRYRNGDEIPQVQDAAEWNRLTTGAWCYYENNSANGVTYGKLYNWYAVNDPRGLAPEGWHVPSDNEWQMLVEKTGGEKASGTKLKSTLLWKEPLVGADNSTGFTAIPAGYRSSNGTFSLLGTNSSFWTSSENNSYSAWFRQMYNTYSAVYRVSSTKTQGLSVRCIKN
ncbi:fibrobacter succinogenes major paralogous domain-containing protein [Chlorobium limicola]|nr:fibrobacter succinogenes major paralogous domain-containing protein [Chlorobium limicola]